MKKWYLLQDLWELKELTHAKWIVPASGYMFEKDSIKSSPQCFLQPSRSCCCRLSQVEDIQEYEVATECDEAWSPCPPMGPPFSCPDRSVPRHFSTDMLESALGDWLWFTSPGIPCYLFPDGTLGYWWLSHSFGMQCLSHLAACSMVGPLRLREPCVAEQMTIPVPLPNIWQSWAPRNIQS